MVDKPSKEELEDAAEICFDYAAYLREIEPRAMHSISVLEEAGDELVSGATFYDIDFGDEDENKNINGADGENNET